MTILRRMLSLEEQEILGCYVQYAWSSQPHQFLNAKLQAQHVIQAPSSPYESHPIILRRMLFLEEQEAAGNTWLLCGIRREFKIASISGRDVERLSLLNILLDDACPTFA